MKHLLLTLSACITLFTTLFLPQSAAGQDQAIPLPQADGYRGLWYQNSKLNSVYRYKYSGGLGTYPANHMPFAVYSPEANKTFFCYGGVPPGYLEKFDLDQKGLDLLDVKGGIQHMVSYFDHATGTVPKPTILLDKKTVDAHDNPVISLDDQGHIWIFSTAHGEVRPAYLHKSNKPHDISAFTRVEPYRTVDGKKEPITNFSYMQAWNLPGQGFVLFFTKYEKWRRETCFAFSPDGIHWTNWTELANIQEGHYQNSAVSPTKAATTFNYHPRAFTGDSKKKGLNWRTNLYYMETPDLGKSWRAADGTALKTPLTDPKNPALVRDFEKDGLLVYIMDIILDDKDHPIILFLTSRGYESGPKGGPRTWQVARWSGKEWSIHPITTSDSNYDMGSLYLEPDHTLRVIAPTQTGPQSGNPGGEIAIWISKDGGKTWNMQRQITKQSKYNHTYVRRPVHAHPDFYGFWADGHGREPSESNLYFCNRDGTVFQLPGKMSESHVKPAAPMLLEK